MKKKKLKKLEKRHLREMKQQKWMKCEICTTQGMFLWELTQMNSVIKNNKFVQEEKVKKRSNFRFPQLSLLL